MDSHIAPKQTKDEVLGDMMRAAEQTRAMGRGNVPGDIEEALGLLKEPQLSSRDIIRAALARKKQDAGNINDWKRFRRRPDYIYAKDPETGEMKPKHRLYTPRKHDFTANVCVMLDTSGSMSNEDMANGISQLQAISHLAEIHVTPNDTAPHWDKTVKVTQKTELTNVKVAGRRGTDFVAYFKDLPKQTWYKGCDIVVIITDGDVNQVPVELMPQSADCLWILT
jgi:predicted metal-dependent peptidase